LEVVKDLMVIESSNRPTVLLSNNHLALDLIIYNEGSKKYSTVDTINVFPTDAIKIHIIRLQGLANLKKSNNIIKPTNDKTRAYQLFVHCHTKIIKKNC